LDRKLLIRAMISIRTRNRISLSRRSSSRAAFTRPCLSFFLCLFSSEEKLEQRRAAFTARSRDAAQSVHSGDARSIFDGNTEMTFAPMESPMDAIRRFGDSG
jgi:hypothetical protein